MSVSWSINPLLKTTLPTEAVVHVAEDINFIRIIYLNFIILSITYPIVHQLLKRLKNYKELGSTNKQLVVLHHAVEVIVLTIATPIYTYYMIKTNFVQEGDDAMASMLNMKSDFTSQVALAMCFMTMYFYEMASRFDNPRPALIVHHLMATFMCFLAFLFPTTVMVKTCNALAYFICFKALTFAGLFMYRIAPLNEHTPTVILGGCVVFAVTRPVQVLWAAAAAFGSWNDPHHVKWQAILQMSLTCAFTALQLWSISINYCVWKRCLGNIKRHDEDKEPNTDADTSLHLKHISTRSISNESFGDLGLLGEDEEDFENEAFETFLKFLNVPALGMPAEKTVAKSPCVTTDCFSSTEGSY